MTVHDLVRAASDRLLAAGLPPVSAAFDAEVLARLALGWNRAEYLARRGDPIPGDFREAYAALIERRERREPVAQIAGHREFWTRNFEVTRDVLTPRPETELLVEEALAWLAACAREAPRVVDVGTGSGCVAVTLALEMPGLEVTATDISPRALAIARRNAGRLGAAARVHFVRTNLLEGIAAGIDLVVSNPPYVPERHRHALSSEVRDYEPSEAVFGGGDGFDLIRSLVRQAAGRLAPRGRLLMEFGAGQDDDVRALVEEVPPLVVHAIRDDLQGIPRVALIGRRADAADVGAGHPVAGAAGER
jgi:release factor glutamine methyltransferase